MKIFLSVSAVLSWLFGLALIFAPAGFYAPTGIAMTALIGTIAEAHGATLVGLGVINWLARKAEGAALRGILAGNLIVQILSFGVAVHTSLLGAGMNVAPAFAIHTILGIGFAYFLSKTFKPAG